MTNPKVLLEDVIKKSTKHSNEGTSELSTIKTTESSCNESNSEVKSIVNNEELQSSILNSKATRKKKNRKSNKKNEIKEKTQSKKNNNGNNSVIDSDECHLPLPDKEAFKNKENSVKNINRNKIVSPNHKLTEYFSELKVDESEKVDFIKGNTRKTQIENTEKSNKDTILSPKHELLNTSSQGRKLRQRKAKADIEKTNHKVTEYFHVRRSERKYKKSIIDEKQKELENKIINKSEDGLEIKEFEGKGRGIITTREFYKGEFVIEYIGELIDASTAKEREIKYAKNKNIGCYMYYFKHKNRSYCVDATKESGKLGRLINHSRKGNLISRIIEVNEAPHLVLLARTDIPPGTELLYDYGDRNPESVKNHPWLTL